MREKIRVVVLDEVPRLVCHYCRAEVRIERKKLSAINENSSGGQPVRGRCRPVRGELRLWKSIKVAQQLNRTNGGQEFRHTG